MKKINNCRWKEKKKKGIEYIPHRGHCCIGGEGRGAVNDKSMQTINDSDRSSLSRIGRINNNEIVFMSCKFHRFSYAIKILELCIRVSMM